MADKNSISQPGHIENESTQGIWVGGEMKTWAPIYGLVGAVVGFFLGVGAALYLRSTSTVPDNTYLSLYITPLFGIFFGAFAGVLVGVGIPKRNPHPDQGGWVSWNTFFSRQRASENNSQTLKKTRRTKLHFRIKI